METRTELLQKIKLTVISHADNSCVYDNCVGINMKGKKGGDGP